MPPAKRKGRKSAVAKVEADAVTEKEPEVITEDIPEDDTVSYIFVIFFYTDNFPYLGLP